MHGESYVTHCGKGEYIIDTDQFPELAGMNSEQVIKWLYDHQGDYGIDHDAEDPDEGSYDCRAFHIVSLDPDNDEQGSLEGYVRDSIVEWDKIKGSEEYFRVIKHMDRKEETMEEMIARFDREHKERIANGLYEI